MERFRIPGWHQAFVAPGSSHLPDSSILSRNFIPLAEDFACKFKFTRPLFSIRFLSGEGFHREHFS
jgi:hypothetical protein